MQQGTLQLRIVKTLVSPNDLTAAQPPYLWIRNQLEVISDLMTCKDLSAFQTLLVKSTANRMMLKSRQMCREHGNTNKTQVLTQWTVEWQARTNNSSTTMQTPFPWAKASTQQWNLTTSQALSATSDKMSPWQSSNSSQLENDLHKHLFLSNLLKGVLGFWGFGVLGKLKLS